MEGEVVPDKERPLSGVILCCTSILPEYREEIASMATQMGAVHKFDLTSDVTHLIVGELNTPKYRYVAKERADIKVLKAEWVEAVRSSWVLGGDTNLQELEEQYRYPTFAGLSICLTGFDDMNHRNSLQKTITDNGAEFRRDLTKSVTHLIARSGYSQKYKYAMLWKITVVSLKWLEDSLVRGMALDENLYDPLLPDEEQGIGAWNRSAPGVPVKRPKAAITNPQRTRKIRRVASMKLGGQNEDIWTDIVGDATRTSNSSASIKTDPSGQMADTPAVIQELKSFASETTITERARPAMTEMSTQKSQELDVARRGFWFGARFFIKGFSSSQTRILETHLRSRDAQIVACLNELAGDIPTSGPAMYILVPHNLPRSELPSIDDFVVEPEIVTDLWIEKCLHNNALVPPEAHITSTPFPKFPIPAFQGLRVCSTGFSGIDLLHLSKLVKVMGATYDEFLTPKASVLICNSGNPNQEKLRHVAEWNIPAVIADWLWISVQTGERKPFTPYIIEYRQPQDTRCPTQLIQRDEVKQNEPKKRKALLEDEISPHTGPDTAKQPTLPARTKEKWKYTPVAREPSVPPGSALQELSANSPRKTASRSPSPSKRNQTPVPTLPVPSVRPRHPAAEESHNNNNNNDYNEYNNDNNQDSKTTLDSALNEFLKQKRRAASSKPSSLEDRDGTGNGVQQQQRKRRKQLLGRANSHSSMLLSATVPGGSGGGDTRISRASSIDTMNEDGHGSVVDGLGFDSSSTPKAHSNAPSVSTSSVLVNKKTDKTEAQQLLESRLEMFRTHTTADFPHGGSMRDHGGAGFPDDDDTPDLTQLGYEIPDAAAMRAKIDGGAAGVADGKDGASAAATATARHREITSKSLVLKENEALDGWGNRRRTRRSGKGVTYEGL
ncbi:BRCT domain-containing protein [Blastomyces gilchristii SLH14081]|uniref:BRCT domain-containing protein n=1 Tax=Blastomyces gilchristii (strain SLH14081) TaxID=559298 RepID=A0A179V0X3_BLAGS|nr:BRCT domain-containing protein [Blastomyces gilchristii SLH14081]OAT13047.1 BRCT domain-containing protein [Blastomyces gilchristii SLH14081]